MRCTFLGRLALLTTIAGSSCVTACASTHATSTLPEPGVYAPAEVVQPYVPSGDPVDPSSTSTLTLEQLLVYADSHSPAIQTARARVGLAEAAIFLLWLFRHAGPCLPTGTRVS